MSQVQYTVCPECGAVDDLTRVNLGGLRLIPQRIHVRGKFPDMNELGSMLYAESLEGSDTCGCSELLVWVIRKDEGELE